ncbi:helix-turn-helix transcriptional regulator [Modestobacter marinus]|uniref:Putative DNA-binding transcriptional regulator YafY n=1 Tax=Modestobacter marinus TaxID=477641 RepID=A0A846LFN1_9ACTN|nr:WYL domain-containing protein [Modestobacter marinus]NIH66983.1 putative DNA-binding transcriptional regulator YafY [Modestobacter marinus]
MIEKNGTSSRLLTLLSLLQARRDWPGAALADRLGVTSRTVRRDVDRLRELGYPVRAVKGPDGGYRLDAGAQLPPLLFDDDQAVALAVALQLAAASGVDVGEAAARALTTVRQVLPARLRHRVDAVRVTPVRTGPTTDVDPAVLVALTAAIRAREVLRFDHTPASGAAPEPFVPPRRVEPHHLVTRGGRWYLVGWDLDRGDWRTFRADRITPRTPTGPRFTLREVPGGDPAAFLSATARGSTDGTGRWPCTGVVELGLPAARVAPFAHDGVVEDLGPQRCRLTLGSWSWVGIAAAVARYDTEVLAVGPPALAEAFGTLAGRFAAAARTAPPT